MRRERREAAKAPIAATARTAASAAIVLGLDGGGTKTHAVVVDERGTVLGFGTSGPSNWESVGIGGAHEAVAAAVDAALGAARLRRGTVTAAAYALAGYDWPSDDARMERVLAGLPARDNRVVVNDAVAALRAGIDGGPGIASVAGTGASTCGRNRRGEVCRTFAASWGEGSGAHGIVRAALHALAREHHATIAPTALTPAILETAGYESTAALFEAITRRGLDGGLAHLAPVVLDVAAGGDQAAVAIVADAGRQHGRDVVGVARRLHMVDDTFAVVRAGGVHGAGSLAFDGAFSSEVSSALPCVVFTTLERPPVVGAALLALEAVGVPTVDIDVDVDGVAATID